MAEPSYNAHGAAGATQGSAEGATTGQKAEGGVKEAYGATEKLRNGINSFFDESIQPSAKHDADRGVDARHKPTTHDPSQNAYTQLTSGDHTTSGNTSTTTGGTGGDFSADAKKMGNDLMSAVRGSK